MIPYQKQVGQLLDPTMYQQSRRHSYHKTSSFTPQSSSLSMKYFIKYDSLIQINILVKFK